MSKTGYLGPEGSYSQLAAQNIRRGTPVAYPSFPALFGALGRDEVSGIVLPVENSLNGGVMQNLDLLQNAEGVLAVGEEGSVKVGAPVVEGATVTGKVIKNGKGKKLNILTYRPKKGSMVRKGHRQPYTKVEITAING